MFWNSSRRRGIMYQELTQKFAQMDRSCSLHRSWRMFLTGRQSGLLSLGQGCLLVALREDKGDVAYPGMFIELLAKKLSTGPGESKAMQPVNNHCSALD